MKKLAGTQLLPPPRADAPAPAWAGKPSEEPAEIYATHSRQVANAALNTLLEALRHEPAMTEQLQAAIAGSRAELVGLEHRIKAPSSLARKIRKKEIEKMQTPEQAATRLDDTIRYTVTTERVADLVPTLTASITTLTAHGWTVRSAEHSFVKGNPYKGIHIIVANEAGQRCEIQYHTESALATKNRGHKEYELYRDVDLSPEERKRAFERCVRLWDDVPTPPGLRKLTTLGGVAVELKDYRPKPAPKPK
ncbi:hypothetical protein H7I77_09835 [Mycolicibacterium novocastrense]|uniref:Type III effector protein n=1 Tax=Mycolicibacterium novocastrense TaxID=59813 RepID=A0AAW5SJS1_MYCNV|nr:hypothetical protein [Mycolicibacterium novocastrense]MCV7023646.1 hypothetical protein [Mycolicibacterium novocastrense]GAT07710.1 type III effector protein [Mycolicibacterium novocastrense]